MKGTKMDFSNSVIIPVGEFAELENAAYNRPNKTVKDRSLDTLQASVLIVVTGAVLGGASWAWVRATAWYDEKLRKMREDKKPVSLR